MIFFLALLGLPIAYLVVLVTLLVRRDPRGIALSLLFATAAAATLVWAIFQSRSSTAGIGIIMVPLMGALGGFFGLTFGRYRTSADPTRKIGAWLGLACALALMTYNIVSGKKETAKNRGRDEKQAAFLAEISRDRKIIDAGLSANRGRERAWMDSSIRARVNDQAFLLAALPKDSISPDLLDSLANSQNLNIALEAVRNPGTRAETLERVYRTKSYPDYFFQALAAHPHTPPKVLLELYHRPQTITGLDIWFAGNPSTPREILDKIARTNRDRSVIQALLANPSLDCGLLTQIGVNLMKVQNRDADDPNVMRVTELLPAVCPGKSGQ